MNKIIQTMGREFPLKEISFPAEKQHVKGMLVLPDVKPPWPAVLYLPDMASVTNCYLPLAERLAVAGIAGLVVNCCQGENPASVGNSNRRTVCDLVSDGKAALDLLSSYPGINPKRIGICGSGISAAVAMTLAHRPAKKGSILRKVVVPEWNAKALILRAPAVYSKMMMETPLGAVTEQWVWANQDPEEIAKTPTVMALGEFSGALLIVASELDRIIPEIIPKTIFRSANEVHRKKLFILKGAGHYLSGDPAWKREFHSRATSWFMEFI